MIITMKHIRAAHFCSRGGRTWFKQHGLDWSRFLREGLDEAEFRKTGDALALKLIEVAHGRQ
jgi:hypothetical protein